MTATRAKNSSTPPLHTWLAEPLKPEIRQSIDRILRAEDVQHVAIMPDVHLSAGVCVGTVVATTRLIYPQALGSDIGCGMTAIAFNRDAGCLSKRAVAERVLDGLRERIPIIRHRKGVSRPRWPDDLAESDLSTSVLQSEARRNGRIEFGTLGRGNHFLEFQSDEDGRLWLLVHSGSRAMGQAITKHHAQNATRVGGGLMYLDAETKAGRDYLLDVAWAMRYARANRAVMIAVAIEVMMERAGAVALVHRMVNCEHDHVRRERHGDKDLWVHRKGANAADVDQVGIIPGSMGTWSFHTAGRGCAAALRSSSHGAGRAMSRHVARRRVTRKQLMRELADVWFDEQLAGKLCEEAPSAYKNVEQVMRAQKDLVRVVRRLRPVLCYKGV